MWRCFTCLNGSNLDREFSAEHGYYNQFYIDRDNHYAFGFSNLGVR